MSRKLNRIIVTAILVSGVSALPGAAQPLMQPNVSVAMARQIVDAAIAHCNQPGDLLTVTIEPVS